LRTGAAPAFDPVHPMRYTSGPSATRPAAGGTADGHPEDRQPESIAAQALGWIDEATRAITPPIHVSTTYLRDPDNQYRTGRVYAAPTTPRSTRPKPWSRVSSTVRRRRCSRRAWPRRPPCSRPSRPATTCSHPKVMYWSLRNWLMGFATHWGLQVELIDMTDPAAVEAALRPGPDPAGLDRDAGESALEHHRHRRDRPPPPAAPARSLRSIPRWRRRC
jgi:hypothetical protein